MRRIYDMSRLAVVIVFSCCLVGVFAPAARAAALVATANCSPSTVGVQWLNAGNVITCNAGATGGSGPYDFWWDEENDGSIDGGGATFTPAFSTAGVHEIALIVTDAVGTSVTGVTSINVYGPPATIALSPQSSTTPIGSAPNIVATVTDANGIPIPNLIVRVGVTGTATFDSSCGYTNWAGQCTFSYRSWSRFPGSDSILAWYDTNGNGVWDGPSVCTHLPCASEPFDTATNDWVLPTSTPGQAYGVGSILGPGPGAIGFVFNAHSDGTTSTGQCRVRSPGLRGVAIDCLDVTAFVRGGSFAEFWGDATRNGVATTYYIAVHDFGGVDDIWIETADGWSATDSLTAGNLVVAP